ncbi:MAG: hypothetical protein RLZZ501_1369, partial [Pseudomonadota bacterium]
MNRLRRALRRPWPDSVVGRTALVLVSALLLTATASVVLFESQRQQVLEAIGGRNAAERVAALVALAEQTDPALRQSTLHRLDTPRFRIGWGEQPVVIDEETFGFAAFVRATLETGLNGREIRVSTRPGPTGGPATGLFGRPPMPPGGSRFFREPPDHEPPDGEPPEF